MSGITIGILIVGSPVWKYSERIYMELMITLELIEVLLPFFKFLFKCFGIRSENFEKNPDNW